MNTRRASRRTPQQHPCLERQDFPPTSSPSSISGRLDHRWLQKDWARTPTPTVFRQSPSTPGSFQTYLLFTILAEQASVSAETMQTLFSPKTRNRSPSHQHQNLGGAERDRTADPLLAKQVLSQLSYSPIRFRYPNGKLRRARPVLPAVIRDHEEEQT